MSCEVCGDVGVADTTADVGRRSDSDALEETAAAVPLTMWASRLAVVGAVVAAVGFLLLHLLMSGAVDPVSQPVSDYALVWPGNGLFAFGTLSLALSCTVLSVAGLGLSRERPVRWLLGSAAGFLALVVVFPTDPGDVVTSVIGEIHRWAASGAFVAIILVGWSVGRRIADDWWRRWLTFLTVLGTIALVLTAANTMLPDVADGGEWRGVPQRLLLAVELVLMTAVAASSARTAAAADVTWPRKAQVWPSEPGIELRSTLRSGDGLRSTAVRRQ
ncbi:MAG: DUF998 domain-containing protein [Stackebrandtia sp.]